ncbi:T9SS type A sorting domain-containing protein, partial [candidate division KSB1 bacterium]|nr:T9SS type A sorting domain-containing protein [candidate division KSB1 bacterium]
PTIRPDAPTGVTARSDQNSALVLWDSQDFEYVKHINIYRSESPVGGYSLIGSRSKKTTSMTNPQLSAGNTYYYRVTVVDTARVESFLSDAAVVTPGSSFTMQSEDADLTGTVWVDDNHPGFHGTAFTNFDASNSSVEFTHMPGFGGGERTLIFRYALGNTSRTGSLIVNGVPQSLTMQGTGDWTNWVIDSVAVLLESGYENTIRFSVTGSDFGNLDEITIAAKPLAAVKSLQDSGIPVSYQLQQNYPNPFNPETTIRYSLPFAEFVTLTVYDILGKKIKTLVNENKAPGRYQVIWDGKDENGLKVASGVYVYRLSAGKFVQSFKMLLIK